MAAIGTAECGADAKALFGEVEADACVLAKAIEVTPDHMAHVNAALHDEILDEPAQVVLRQRGDDGRALAPAFPHGAGDVVLAAAFPDLEATRIAHTAKTGVETQHDFAERDAVPFRFGDGFDDQFAHVN